MKDFINDNFFQLTILAIILVIPFLLLCGCDDKRVNGKDSVLQTYCDKGYGIEYVRDVGFNRGGITVRLDENGNVIHCK